MLNPFRLTIRALGFTRKEILEISRQPRLLVTLVLTPFLILLLFGIGYRKEEGEMRALFVAGKNNPIAGEIYRSAITLDRQVQFLGIFSNLEAAREKLRKKEVDLIVVVPENAGEVIHRNEQAVFTFIHNEIDPAQAESVRLKGEIYVDKLNHWLLDSAVENGREQLLVEVNECIVMAHEIRKALERADTASAREMESRLKTMIGEIGSAIRSRIEALEAPQTEDVGEILTIMNSIRLRFESGLVPGNVKRSYAEDAQKASALETDLIVLSAQLKKLRLIDARLLLSPFSGRVQELGRKQPRMAEYFSPGIVILLLQHLAITFAALSLVREFKGKRKELFHVSPLRAEELLVGKYVGQFMVCGSVAWVLTALMIYGFRYPMMGHWIHYASVIAVLIVASLGIGFVISGLSNSEEQAVLYSMLFFVVSIFFSGFLLSLQHLWGPVNMLSWALPATYGIRLAQDVMLRGSPLEPGSLAILALLGLVLFPAAARLSKLKMAHIQRSD